jgi:hypothetical protein
MTEKPVGLEERILVTVAAVQYVLHPDNGRRQNKTVNDLTITSTLMFIAVFLKYHER